MDNKYILCALGLLGGSLSFAQISNYVESSNVVMREVKDQLQVSLQLSQGRTKIGKMETITITPYLKGQHNEMQSLPPFVLYGKNRRKLNIRQAKLNGKSPEQELKDYHYKGEFPFQLWMEDAQLVLDIQQTGCAKCPSNRMQTQLPAVVELVPKIPYVMRPMANFVMPDVEPIKNRAESGTSRIEFPSGKMVLISSFKKNETELAKINTAIHQVINDTLAEVQSIILTAYSSPDGSYATNQKLSKARAESLKTYIIEKNALKGISVETQSGSEDWKTLRKMIIESDYTWKEAALKIIDETDNFDARERKLKTLAGGRPYRMMLAEWFPQLRRVEYQLNYSVKDFTLEQGREIIKKRPGQLSLNEIFHVANSYEQGSPEFNEVFDIAVRLFPDNPVANINAAAAAIGRRELPEAKKYLDRVMGYPQANNNLAAYYMLIEDTEKAGKCLKQADNELPEVKHNLNELKLKEENRNLLEKYKKR